jgi:formylglycine-generating enzyme required for sulfatase activity
MGNNPSYTKGVKFPVTNVSREDCQEFIKKINAKTNGGYRLPTESEWEYACRAGTTTAYSFGNSLTKSDANIDDYEGSKAVGSYKPNAFDLYDMHGNVWELVEDCWHDDYSSRGFLSQAPTDGSAWTSACSTTEPVLRGGAWYGSPASLRSPMSTRRRM